MPSPRERGLPTFFLKQRRHRKHLAMSFISSSAEGKSPVMLACVFLFNQLSDPSF